MPRSAPSAAHAPAVFQGARASRPASRRRVRTVGAAVLVSGALVGLSLDRGEARPLRPGETVLDRPRPEMTEHGGRLGRIWVRPTVQTGLAFDDNVFANDAERQGDLLLRTAPSFTAETDWRGHRASFSASAEQGVYNEQSSENYLDLSAEAFGRLQATQNIHVSATARWTRRHEPRRSADSPSDAAEPTVFRTRSSELLLKSRGDRGVLSARLGARRIDYDDVAARGGGAINNDDRDGWLGEFTIAERAPLSLRLERFLRSRLNVRLYDAAIDDNGFIRGSWGHATVGGLTWRPTGLTTLEGYSGVRQQVYADSRFDPLLLPTAGLSVTVSPSQLTSVRVALDQAVRETTQPFASGRLVTALSVRVDHELKRDLLAGLHANAAVDDYRGIARRDRHTGAGLSLTYLASRYLHARLSLRHTRRDSDAANARTFRRTRIELGLEVRY